VTAADKLTIKLAPGGGWAGEDHAGGKRGEIARREAAVRPEKIFAFSS